jgi:hypothetical protein
VLDCVFEPDQPARAYLTVIAGDPEGVLRAAGCANASTVIGEIRRAC